MLAVATGKADFTVVNSPSADQFMESNPGQVELLEPAVKYIPINISFAQNEPKLKAMLEIATEELVLSGQIDQILNKYDLEAKLYKRARKPYQEN